jgi:hypothetical protein
MKVGAAVKPSKDHPGDVYMQLLFPNDPAYIKDALTTDINVTSTGKLLEGDLKNEKVNKLLNLWTYRLLMAGLQFNRTGSPPMRADAEKAYLQYDSSAGFPYPSYNTMSSWLTDTTENKVGKYFEKFKIYSRESIRTFIEAFINGLNIDSRTFKLTGKLSKNSAIKSTDNEFDEFLNAILTYAYNEIVLVSGKRYNGDASSLYQLTLGSIIGFRSDIWPLVDIPK